MGEGIVTKHSARLEHEWGNNEPITGAELQAFAAKIPEEARVSAILRDIGSQRDPDRVTVGLVAVWGE